MRKVEMTGGARKGEEAFFHGFFQVGNLEHGCDPVAVIEFSDGTCGDYSSSYIRFINPPAKELVEG